jgi:hypothetical protein
MGVPIVDTLAQTAGRFNILDTSQMVMGIRENFNIRMFETNEDDAKYNRILIRAEARVSFANYSASNVIQGTF